MDISEYIACGKDVYDFFKDGIIVIKLDHAIIYSNKSASQLLGFKKNELLNKKIKEVSQDLFEVIARPKYKNILNAKKIEFQSLTFENKKKSHLKTLTYITSLGDKNTSLGYMIVFKNPNCTGVNKIKHFNKNIPFIKALNVKKDEFCYISDLKNGRNVFASDSCEKFLGWKAENFVAGSWAFAISKTHPDDVANIQAYYKNRERWKKYPHKYDHIPLTYKYRMLHRHGHYVNVKVSVMLLERDKNDAPAYSINFGKTYTDKSKRSNELSEKLTPREKEIGKLLTEGNSSKLIAEKLGISGYTVDDFKQQLKEKLGASNSAETVRILIEKKLL